MEVQYHHENAGLSCSVGLTAVPVVEVNGTFGNGKFAIGGEVAFDTSTGELTKYNTGVGITEPDFTAALLLYEIIYITFLFSRGNTELSPIVLAIYQNGLKF